MYMDDKVWRKGRVVYMKDSGVGLLHISFVLAIDIDISLLDTLKDSPVLE